MKNSIATAALLSALAALAATSVHAATPAADTAIRCTQCEQWNAPQEPFAIYGNTYYVGVHGLSSVLIASPAGHILIDGGTPQSAPQVIAHIRRLGFDIEDVRYILNSHVHFDHAGAIAELQRRSGAEVLTSAASVAVLKQGESNRDDPQYGDVLTYPPVAAAHLRAVADGEVVRLGPLAVTAHFTPGHTPGGVSWTWTAIDGGKPAAVVYADSVSAYAADGFRYSGSAAYPQARADLERSFATLAALPCDVLISAHPDAGGLWERKAKQATLGNAAFVDPEACRTYAANGRARLRDQLADEAAAR